MPTICSAMRKGDRTVGTSTICSADCGSGIRGRERHEKQEILGTSITCSVIGRSRIRKVSVTFSTGCGTRASRICTKGQMSAMCSKKCRSNPTCGPRGTPRQGGREPPWGRGASWTSPCESTRTSPPALGSSPVGTFPLAHQGDKRGATLPHEPITPDGVIGLWSDSCSLSILV